MCYKVISQSVLANMTLKQIEQFIKTIPHKLLRDLCYYDIYRPENSCIGFYFFESPLGDKLYIGKSCSRSITDRVGAHFDCRKGAFLNSLPRAVFNANYPHKKDTYISQDLHDVFIVLREWNFSALFVEWTDEDYVKQLISKIEGMLIFDLQPQNGGNCINGTNRIHSINVNIPVKNLIP